MLNTDQYGALGKNEKLLLKIIKGCAPILQCENLSGEDKASVCRNCICETVGQLKDGTKTKQNLMNFVEEMERILITEDDAIVFYVTAKYMVLPTNAALERVPSSDEEFTINTAKNILKTFGPAGAGKVIAVWDELGTNGCLNEERTEVIDEFYHLKKNLRSIPYTHTKLDDSILLTAFVQEFERRLGQKRKSRAGGSLEDVATFLFNYYHIKAAKRPEHFQSDLEVDKWFKCKDGWLVGISCKRTLRERWKQVSSASVENIGEHHIKEIWHLVTYVKDLSDDKITRLGKQHQTFYLRDDSPRYQECKTHPILQRYVRPLSNFIHDIYELQGKDYTKLSKNK